MTAQAKVADDQPSTRDNDFIVSRIPGMCYAPDIESYAGRRCAVESAAMPRVCSASNITLVNQNPWNS
jgi:hypothetical protein